MLNDLSPATLGKILTFMYHGDIPESYRRSLESNASTHLPLNQKFPATDKFLTTVKGKPTTISLNDGSTRTTGTVTNKEKWAIMLGKQAALKEPYDIVACKDYGEVIFEIDLYAVAEKLEVLALKEVAMNKVSAWFEVGLQAGLPLSNEFRTCAIYVLRGHHDFAQSFVGLSAKHFSVIEKDSALASLIEELHPISWNAMKSVRRQWSTELEQYREDLEKSKEQVSTLISRLGQEKVMSGDFEKALESQTETLSKSLACAQGRADAAEMRVARLENLNTSLQ